jgi:hypothetical protein
MMTFNREDLITMTNVLGGHIQMMEMKLFSDYKRALNEAIDSGDYKRIRNVMQNTDSFIEGIEREKALLDSIKDEVFPNWRKPIDIILI